MNGLAERVFQRLLPPSEVRDTCQGIESFLAADNGLCIDTVKAKALALARNAGKTVYTIRVSNFTPDQLALTLIFNVLTSELQSGKHHLYSNMLSMMETEMLRLWRVTAKELVTRGYSTQQEYDADLAGLRADIRSLG